MAVTEETVPVLDVVTQGAKLIASMSEGMEQLAGPVKLTTESCLALSGLHEELRRFQRSANQLLDQCELRGANRVQELREAMSLGVDELGTAIGGSGVAIERYEAGEPIPLAVAVSWHATSG